MCGRFAVDSEVEELIRDFLAQGGDIHDWRPSYNLAPTDQVPVVIESSKSGELVRRLELARWSLTPTWSKTLQMKGPTFNARSEAAGTTAMFKAAVASKRALIPATGYYEWRTEGKVKTPYFIHDPSGERIAFAALYSWWKDATKADDDPARWVLTTTILTMDTVPGLASIHPRNPVPLPREFWSQWLDPSLVGDQQLVDEAVALGIPVASSLEAYEVGPVRGDSPDLIRPVADVGSES
jgi:putative SOS response-associated peptidase YedK